MNGTSVRKWEDKHKSIFFYIKAMEEESSHVDEEACIRKALIFDRIIWEEGLKLVAVQDCSQPSRRTSSQDCLALLILFSCLILR